MKNIKRTTKKNFINNTVAIFSAMVIFSFLSINDLIDSSTLIVSATADDKVKAAEQRLNAAKEDNKRIETEKAAIERDRSSLEQHKKELRLTLNNLDADMAEIVTEIARLELAIEYKLLDIEQAELDLAEAIRIKEQQYEDMKKRVKHSYEQPEFNLLEMLLKASSLSEFLNIADNLEQLAKYEQMKLEEFREIEEMVTEKKEHLEEEKVDLDNLLIAVESEQERVNDLIKKASSSINYTSAQISEAEQDLIAKEDEIKRKSMEIEQLEKDLAEEKRLRDLANQLAWRNLSDINYAEGDRYLLANLIYCEAGGEPYQGQVAVGAVVINRMLSPVFADTISGVIYSPRQFSPVASGRLALALAENKATASCYKAADEAMSGATPVGNALFFRTPIEGVTGQYIGGHVFY